MVFSHLIKQRNYDRVAGKLVSRDKTIIYDPSSLIIVNEVNVRFSFLRYCYIKLSILFMFNRNILGYREKNDNVLYIMRALPGAGKSTEAKKLVGKGVIHSTDDIMTDIGGGNYSKAFKMFINDKPAISIAHRRNYFNAKKSMMLGVSPIVIDNTNLKRRDVKNYAMVALELGYKDENIIIIDLGLNGCTLEELALRNTHNVGMEILTPMYQTYKDSGPVSLEIMFKK